MTQDEVIKVLLDTLKLVLDNSSRDITKLQIYYGGTSIGIRKDKNGGYHIDSNGLYSFVCKDGVIRNLEPKDPEVQYVQDTASRANKK